MNLKFSEQTRNRIFLAAAFLVYAALYFVFYPPIYAFRDEGSYLAAAGLFRQGKLWADYAYHPAMAMTFSNGHWATDYPPGQSWLLVLFSGKAAYLTGLIAHLAAAWIFSRLLKLYGLTHPLLTVLYLYFPAFVFYSRTVMGDVPSTALLLAGYYFYFQDKRPGWAGFFLGMSFFFRATNVLPVGAVVLCALVRMIKRKSISRDFILPLEIFIFGCLVLVWNRVLYGGFLAFPRFIGYDSIGLFSPVFAGMQIRHYAVSLLLMYPLMLAAPLLARKTRSAEAFLISAALLACYLFYYFHDQFSDPLTTWIFGTRFLFPIMPFFLLCYAELADISLRALGRLAFPVSVMAFVVLAAGSGAVHFRHQQALNQQAEMVRTIYETVPEGAVLIYDVNVSELLQEEWGKRQYVRYNSGDDELLRDLQNADLSRGLYWVKRSVIYGGQLMPSLGIPEEIPFYISRFEIEKIYDKNGLAILTMKPRHEGVLN